MPLTFARGTICFFFTVAELGPRYTAGIFPSRWSSDGTGTVVVDQLCHPMRPCVIIHGPCPCTNPAERPKGGVECGHGFVKAVLELACILAHVVQAPCQWPYALVPRLRHVTPADPVADDARRVWAQARPIASSATTRFRWKGKMVSTVRRHYAELVKRKNIKLESIGPLFAFPMRHHAC